MDWLYRLYKVYKYLVYIIMEWSAKARVDLECITLEKLSAFLCYCSSVFAYAIEDTETHNPHVHIFLITTLKMQCLRRRLKTYLKRECGGNGSYSLVALDEPYSVEYLAYLIKQNRYHLSDGFPSYKLEEAKKHDAKVKEDLKRKKKKRVVDIIDDLVTERIVAFRGSLEECIQDCIYVYHADNGILLREHIIRSYFTTILCRRDVTFRNSFMRYLCDRTKYLSW